MKPAKSFKSFDNNLHKGQAGRSDGDRLEYLGDHFSKSS